MGRVCAAGAAEVRFLHTGDWHLGRTIDGRSRLPECERALDNVVRVAREEKVDVVLIAGDTFDAFGPPADAQKLLYETLARFVGDGIKVVMIAGNHDSAPRMDALSGILEYAGVHAVGTPPRAPYTPVRLASRSGEAATIVAVPWIAERYLLEFGSLFAPEGQVHGEYAQGMEDALAFYAKALDPGTIRVLLGHMFVSKARPGGGERALQVGDLFAVPGQSLPATAQYIALGHVHKDQELPGSPVSGASFYCGSLIQLDFGEAEQEKTVRIVDIPGPNLPADSRKVKIEGGITLRDIHCTLETLLDYAGKHDGEYLRVFVELEGVDPSLTQRVRDVLPDALQVIPVRTDIPAQQIEARRQGLEPHELLSRYYRETHGQAIPADLIALFNRMHEEALHAAS